MELHLSGHIHLEAGVLGQLFNNGFSPFELFLKTVFILSNLEKEVFHSSVSFDC